MPPTRVLHEPAAPSYDFITTVGSTEPSMAAQLTDENDEPIPISGASVRFRLSEPSAPAGTYVADGSAIITDVPNAIVEYQWTESDVASAGHYNGAFHVDYSGASGPTFEADEAFPSEGYMYVKIQDTL